MSRFRRVKEFFFKCVKLILLLTVFLNSGKAQQTLYGIKNTGTSFEFAGINTVNDSITVYLQLPLNFYSPSFSSCYDASGSRYFYSTGQKIFVIDVNAGLITDTFDFVFIHPSYFLNIVYNPLDGFLYGIKKHTATLIEQFAKFNPVSGIFLDTINLNQNIEAGTACKSIIDAQTQQYIIQSSSLAAIDIATSQVLYNTPILNQANETFDHMAYSCKLQTLFGLSNNPVVPEEYFASINSSANVAHVNSAPLPVSYYKQYQSGSSIDNNSDIYYYAATNGIIYGIDIHTGSVVYDHNYGSGFEFLFLESASDYYCPIADVKNINSKNRILVFPNPANADITFSFTLPGNPDSQLHIYTNTMQLISSENLGMNEVLKKINIDSYTPGLYIYTIVQNDQVISTGKFSVIR